MNRGGSCRRWAAVALGAVVLTSTACGTGIGGGGGGGGGATLTPVVLVGNAVSGTVSFIDPATDKTLGSFNIIPDLKTVLANMTVGQQLNYAIANADEATVDPAVGGNRFVDDMALSPAGTTLYVSRANLADVAAFNLLTGQELWRVVLPSLHADHMALSPDGTQLVVSATTASTAYILNTADGTQAGTFATGNYAHGNDYSANGLHIYNSSIGITALPYSLNSAKGPFLLTEADAKTFKIIRTWSFPYGIRPNLISADETTMWTDLSYLNGFEKYDLTTGTVLATVNQPYSPAAQALTQDQYPQNSAHHGIALSGDSSRICDAGTIDDYTAIVSTATLKDQSFVNYPAKSIPYWTTTSADGTECFVSLSGGNSLSVINYTTGQEVARIPVGSFPQRNRLGAVPASVLAILSPSPG